ALSFLTTEARGQEIRIGYHPTLEPFSSTKKGSAQVEGLVYDVLKETFKRMGIKVTHKAYPWKRTSLYVKTGKIDAFFGTVKKARQDFGEYGKEEVASLVWRIYTYKDHPRLKSINRLRTIEGFKDYKLVSFRGSATMETYFVDKGYDIHFLDNNNQLPQFLDKKRADIAIAIDYNMQHWLKKKRLENQIIELPTEFEQLARRPMFLIVSKISSYKSILPKFDETLRKMKQDGTYQAIIRKYE
ncbi:transporter substrate-binding domain-containing protein, partial [Desulfobacterales bacterium HSG16]|nr:transporter substrate-binding domain-containing protein [Desulfobacterales bacterium HSG16]